MKKPVFVGDGGGCEVVMPEFYCVRDDERLCEGVNNLEAAVVFEGWADVEPIASTTGPGQVFVGLVVDDDGTATGADRCGIEVVGALLYASQAEIAGAVCDCWRR